MTFHLQLHPPGEQGGSTPTLDTSDQSDLVERIRRGDEAAFERLFRTYYSPLCRYVVGYLGSRDSAEDVVQGVFARIWGDRTQWVVRDLHHYLYAAASRGAMSYFRRAAVRRRAAPSLLLAAAEYATSAPAADAEFEAAELRHRLDRAIAALPPRTRAAFVLSRAEGLSYAEVASRLAMSPKTVGVHIARALSAMRATLRSM
ncbi:MAG TPA: RNA polymerase sigma-70 factor [Gemmatimonadales bacterium]|nr:RNA polymerase sigma-70 factor [Gemmatimonadales bacterium]